MASKVLVIGAPNGSFTEAFTKATALNSKTSFDIAIVLGDLFAPADDNENVQRLLRGEIIVPIPTYFGLGAHPFPQAVQDRINTSAGQLCENLFFLGKKAILTTSEGIRIVALGGTLDPSLVATAPGTEDPEAALSPFYSETEAGSLAGANHCDILLTYDWPENVGNGSKVSLAEKRKGSKVVSRVARMLRPRYHLVPGGELYYEREPYHNELKRGEGQGDVRVTRYLAIGDFGNAKKAKALYAFNINPKETNVTIPNNCTTCPYLDDESKGKKRPLEDGSGSFFWGDHSGQRDGHRGKRGRGRGRGGRDRAPPPGPESCFFCLSYPQLEKHLIVSIGDESYLTTAKGPLTSPETNPPSLFFSSHILIIPLTHAPTITAIEDHESRQKTLDEMHKYRLAIEQMLNSNGCGAVTFEVARTSGVHAHWQVIPVAKDKLGTVEEAFDEEAKNAGLAEFEDDVEEPFHDRGDFFKTWITGREKARVLKIEENAYFDLQFGRRVMAKVIGTKGVNWRDCVLGFDEEVKDAEKFKDAFREFDFT